MERTAIDRLILFVEKVERLHSLSLVQSLVERGARLSLSWTAESGGTLTLFGPDAEQIDAFVLTLRLFIQNNDPISLGNMAQLYEGLPVSAELKKSFATHRANFNQTLDERCMLDVNGDQPTRREVLDTVLYGHLSHLNPRYRQRYRSWTQSPMASIMIDCEFVEILILLLRSLGVLAKISRGALRELLAAPPSVR